MRLLTCFLILISTLGLSVSPNFFHVHKHAHIQSQSFEFENLDSDTEHCTLCELASQGLPGVDRIEFFAGFFVPRKILPSSAAKPEALRVLHVSHYFSCGPPALA